MSGFAAALVRAAGNRGCAAQKFEVVWTVTHCKITLESRNAAHIGMLQILESQTAKWTMAADMCEKGNDGVSCRRFSRNFARVQTGPPICPGS